jgi:hypothetical protein
LNRLARFLSTDLTGEQIRYALLAAYLLHVVIIGLFLFDVIPQEYHRDGYPFWFHQGGDDYGYFSLARDLTTGELHANKYPLGFPVLLLPFVAFLPSTHDALLQPVAMFWALVMFPIGQNLLFRLAYRLSKQAVLALFSVFLWTGLPLLAYAILRVITNAVVAETASVHMTWAQMLSDGPATLFTLLGMIVFFVARERHYPAAWVLLAGGLGGFLMLIRLTGVLTVGVIGLLLLIERQWRAAVLFAVSAGIVFAPQLLYNWHFFDSPLRTGYNVLDKIPPDGLVNLRYLLDALAASWRRVGMLLPVALVLAVGLGGMGLVYLWQKLRLGALAIGLWIIGYAVFYGVYYHSWQGGIFRFLMPAYPALVILAAGTIGFAAQFISQRGSSVRTKPQ